MQGLWTRLWDVHIYKRFGWARSYRSGMSLKILICWSGSVWTSRVVAQDSVRVKSVVVGGSVVVQVQRYVLLISHGNAANAIHLGRPEDNAL